MARRAGRSAAETRERILEAAAQLLARRGYAAANVEEIARISGASKGAFYFHFPSKERMIHALVDQSSEKLVSRVRETIAPLPPSKERLELAVRVLLETFARKRRLGHVLLVNIVGRGRVADRKFWPVRRKFLNFIHDELEAARQAGVLGQEIDTELASRVWLGALHECILHWLLADRADALASQAAPLAEYLLDGVRRSARRQRPRDGKATS